jgi:hypothetical protein
MAAPDCCSGSELWSYQPRAVSASYAVPTQAHSHHAAVNCRINQCGCVQPVSIRMRLCTPVHAQLTVSGVTMEGPAQSSVAILDRDAHGAV